MVRHKSDAIHSRLAGMGWLSQLASRSPSFGTLRNTLILSFGGSSSLPLRLESTIVTIMMIIAWNIFFYSFLIISCFFNSLPRTQ